MQRLLHFYIVSLLAAVEQRGEGEEGGVQRDHGGCEHRRTAARATVQLRPETPGKHSGGISGNSECFILIHALLRYSGQL